MKQWGAFWWGRPPSGLTVIYGPKEATWVCSLDPVIGEASLQPQEAAAKWSCLDCTTKKEGREGLRKEGGREKLLGFKRPGGGEREGWWLTLQPPADIPFYREENRQGCHSGLAPPSILSSLVQSLQGSKGGGRGWRSPLTSALKVRGMTHRGHF